MKAEPYKNYKPANAAWLNALPETWGQIRGRFVMAVNPPARRARVLEETDEVSFVPMEAVGEYGGLDLERTKPLDEIGAGYTAFEEGDVVVAKITPCFENSKGAIARGLKNGVGFGTTELHVLRVGKRLDSQFMFYLTISHTFRMLGESEMYGAGGQKRVPPEFAKDFCIPLPPLAEQQTIARFLDAKTAQIDELIDKKRQLIAKLKEKRQALIARTVTRGLPPEVLARHSRESGNPGGADWAPACAGATEVTMKDSGVDWLGAVPKDWQVKRLGFMCAKIGSGKTPSGGSETYEDSGIVFLRSQNVYDEGLELSDVAYINEGVDAKMKHSRVESFDVLLNITGASIGRSCLVPKGFSAANVNQHVCIVRLADKSISEFVSWVLKAPFIKSQIDSVQSGAAREGLNFDQISKFLMALPGKDECNEICEYLERETDRIDSLIRRTEIAIALLTEYRQALITSAVTGKIDVRGFRHARTSSPNDFIGDGHPQEVADALA